MSNRIKYFGWSSFIIKSKNVSVGIDPYYRKMADTQWFNAWDFEKMDVICLSHKHGEHSLDIPEFADRDNSVVVAPDQHKDILIKKGVRKSNIILAKPYEMVYENNVKITTFPWEHRDIAETTNPEAKKISIGSNQDIECYGHYIETIEGNRILNVAEGANKKITNEYLERLSAEYNPNILIVGIQLDFEDAVAAMVKKTNPEKVIIFHPHEKLFEIMGLETSPREVFVDKIKEKAPNCEVIELKIGEEISI